MEKAVKSNFEANTRRGYAAIPTRSSETGVVTVAR